MMVKNSKGNCLKVFSISSSITKVTIIFASMNFPEHIFTAFSLQGIWGVIFIIYSLSWLVNMLFLWFVLSRLAFYKPGTAIMKDHSLPPVSLIISAKNEYHNLKENLPLILGQDYPSFEVIVVNDASDDDTAELLDDYRVQYPHLRIVTLYKNLNFFKGKKFPLSMGIRSARHKHLLLTDADCKPSGRHWIRHMASSYKQNTEVVLGYGKYESTPTLVNLLQRYDTVTTAMQYLSLALHKVPYMGVGRNLSYLKTLFEQRKGFSSHYKVQSGDDDLFINQVATGINTEVCIHKEAFTISRATRTFTSWIRQKRRHFTTGAHYKRCHKWRLGILNTSRLLFWGTLIALMIRSFNTGYVLALAVILLISFYIIMKKTMNVLQEKGFWLASPFIDIFLTIIYLFITFANLMRKPDKWK